MDLKKVLLFYNKHQFVCLLFVNILFVVLMVNVFCWQYESNDDLTMAWIASGCFLGNPDMHLVYVNALYGFMLSRLYIVLPSIEWYTLLFLLFHILSLTILSKWFLNLKIIKAVKTCMMVLLYLLEARLLLLFQFTTTAGLLASAAFILMFDRSTGKLWCGCLLFVLASLIRFYAAMIVGSVFFVFYPLYLYFYKFSFIHFLVLCACVAFSIMFKFIDGKIYQSDPAWEYYSDCNAIRGKINDNPNSWRAFDYLPDNLINEDYSLFLWYFFQDPSLFNKETLETVYDTIEERSSHWSIPNVKKMKNVLFSLKEQYQWFLVLVPLLLLFLFAMEDTKGRLRCILFFIGLLVVFLLITMNTVFKERAWLCAYFSFLVFSFSMFEKLNMRQIPTLIVCLVIVGWFSFKYYPILKLQEERVVNDEARYLLERTNKTPITIGDLSTSSLNPMEIKEGYIDTFAKGWTTMMPNKKCISSYLDLVDEEIPIALRKDCFIAVNSALRSSLRFHHHIEVEPCVLVETEHYLMFCLRY